MDSATFNGIPLTTYGLIGATTMLLAYSVFRDDSNEKEPVKTPEQGSATKSGFFTSPLASKSPEATVTEQTKEVATKEVATKEVATKEEEKMLTDSPKKDESPPAKAVGGKRKRTKRRRHKNKRTRNNHK